MEPMSTINPFAAPGELEVVRRFINTLDIESGIDGFATTEGARAWLESWGLIGELDRLAEVDRAEIVALREGLRAVAEANHGGRSASAEALLSLDRAAAHVRYRFGPDGPQPEPSGRGADKARATLVSLVITAHNDGTWGRLKICSNDDCRWAFYDHARNRTSRWCSMNTCGNRLKARAYRARLATAP
jgi:predicted RNA-binding Zn ribbon-like protein